MARLLPNVQYSVITDHLGTPTALYDHHGQERYTQELDIYGKARASYGDKRTNLFRYPGQYEDLETGLSYNRFRYYDAGEGFYISQDPIGLAGGNPTLYGYVGDVNGAVDVLGLACSSASGQLPSLRGKSVSHVEDILRKNNFVRTNPNNVRNQTWRHADGSKAMIHAYGDQTTKVWKTANNAHVHKYSPNGGKLDDFGVPNTSMGKETHIGIKNPADLPSVAGRPHGTGTM